MTFLNKDFKCVDCSPGEDNDTPSYLVCDGKCVASTSRKVSHLSEFGCAEGDDEILPQGSTYENRVFLPNRKERQILK